MGRKAVLFLPQSTGSDCPQGVPLHRRRERRRACHGWACTIVVCAMMGRLFFNGTLSLLIEVGEVVMRLPAQHIGVNRRQRPSSASAFSGSGIEPSSCRWCDQNYGGAYNSACDDGRWILCLNLGNNVPYSEALENSYQYCRNQYDGLYETACIQGAQHCDNEC